MVDFHVAAPPRFELASRVRAIHGLEELLAT
jgi:hypothetical protein